jgi:WhiB family redox-sensing transcriptional regulator
LPSTPTQPIVVTRIGTWTDDAACRKPDAEDAPLFYGPEGESTRERRKRESAAKAICARCPVIQACYRHAMSAPELYGVWGGASESDRRRHGRTTPRRGRPPKTTTQPAAQAA